MHIMMCDLHVVISKVAHILRLVSITCTYTDHTQKSSNLEVSQIHKKVNLCTVLQDTEIYQEQRNQRYFFLFPPGPAQFKMCYDNTATDCNGTGVVNVTTASDCCLGAGYWFDDEAGTCHQCIGKQILVRAIHVEMYSLLHCLCGNGLWSTYRQSI